MTEFLVGESHNKYDYERWMTTKIMLMIMRPIWASFQVKLQINNLGLVAQFLVGDFDIHI